MTQDQYGQARGPGYVVRDEAVPDDENEEFPDGESKPMTRFQKVASALRGGSERDEQDQADEDELAADPVAADPVAADQASADQAAMANSPISRDSNPRGDYWDETTASAADRDEAVAVTSPGVPVSETGTDPLARQDQGPGQAGPDAMDHPATQPNMFGTTTHADNGATSASYLEDHADSPTLPDGPANGAQANGFAASGVPAGDVPAGDVPASDVPAGDVPAGGIPPSGVAAGGVPAGEATGMAGRHAATAPGDTESRPGEATGALGDFSDLSYGDLLPDATQYTSQWQQIQFKFVDDPQASVTEAADIIAQVTTRLEAAIQERQRAIEERQRAIAEQQRSLRDRWGEGTNADTEALRATLRLYKTFLDQLIGPRAG